MRRIAFVITLLCLTAAAACGDPSTTVEDQLTAGPIQSDAPVVEIESSPATTASSNSDTPVDDGSVVADCEAPATEIAVDTAVDGTVDQDKENLGRQYFCIQVPSGVTMIEIGLTGLTANLDIFVGYPDLETVQGGGVDFWWSDQPGTGDETVAIEPGLIRGDLGNFEETDFVRSGPYYVEVSGESSSFTLTAKTS